MENKKNNYSLAEALRVVISTYGRDMLSNSMLINILNDFYAFNEVKQTKIILQSIISEEYIEKILLNKELNDVCKKIEENFISYTGFRSVYVEYVFNSLYYGLEWSNEIPIFKKEIENNNYSNDSSTTNPPKKQDSDNKKTKDKNKNNPSNTNPSKKQNSVNKKDNNSNSSTINPSKKNNNVKNIIDGMTEEEFENYILPKIKWNHNLENLVGLKFENLSISRISNSSFIIKFHIKRKFNKKNSYLRLKYAAFDLNGQLKGSGQCLELFKGNVPSSTGMIIDFEKTLDKLNWVLITISV